MENSINIMDLSEEELEFMTEEDLVIFERLKHVLIDIKTEVINELGEEPKINNLNITTKGKLQIILKKLAKNAIISGLTGISPIFLDNDLSELKNNSIEYFMQSDIPTLVYSIINDAIGGIEEVINRLKSNEKRNEMLNSIDKLYEEYIDKEYGSGKRKDYSFLIGKMLAVHSNIYNTTKANKLAALFERGYHLGMGYDFLADIREVYSKIDSKTNKMGR